METINSIQNETFVYLFMKNNIKYKKYIKNKQLK